MKSSISPTEQKLRSIMQSAPIGLIEIADNGSIQNLNLKGEIILKLLSGNVIHEGHDFFPIADIVSVSISEAIKAFRHPSGQILINEQYSFEAPDQTVSYFLFGASKMFADCIIVTIDDITLRIIEEQSLKKAEQDKAVAQGKYEIASEVLHDIGNAIVGFGTYLTRFGRLLDGNNLTKLDSIVQFLNQQRPGIAGAIGEAKADALVAMLTGISTTSTEKQTEMQHAVTEQLRIIKHIQDILNIQRQYVLGREPQERKPVNLNEILYDCKAMINANLEKKGIAVAMVVSAAAIQIKGDRTKLMQVILNVLKNSIEAIEDTAPIKEIKITLSEENGEVTLSIADTGKGIAKDVQERLFTRGFTTRENGTGLGLYNCRSIVESHSGSILLKSDGAGKGSNTIIKFNK
jgi:signal transduction histidine kinase